MAEFSKFAQSVNGQYTRMAQGELYTVNADGLYDLYLQSFPDGTNPIYLAKTEHDCTTCRNFIRNLGAVVAIVDGKVQTVWDVDAEYPYDQVARALADHIRSLPITGIFRSKEPKYGAQSSLQRLDGESVRKWNHLFGTVANKHLTGDVAAIKGRATTQVATLRRGLEELSPAAVEQVAELIRTNAIYRGAEHTRAVAEFQKAQTAYLKLDARAREIWLWSNWSHPASHFRNSVIGTLVQDITSSDDLDASVRAFETKVAPTNYKRPTALITPAMVKNAMATISQLGMEQSLERRLARISDVSVNDVLWVNGATQAHMRGGIESLLMEAATTASTPDTTDAETIGVDEFMTRIAPRATGIELLVKNADLGKFVTLTAPVHPDAPGIFKWPNPYGWSYDGNITDSIRERVKRAGGRVDNCALRVSLAWYNNDDLDLHCEGPHGHIYFGRKADILDVDMNGGGGMSPTRTPVENMSFGSSQMRDGEYHFHVHQWARRETTDVGFEIEVADHTGVIHQFTYDRPVTDTVRLFSIRVKGGVITQLKHAGVKALISGSASQTKWGVASETFACVNTILNSPNHWGDSAVGNKHWIFVLEGCKTDTPARGIYNEFLKPELDTHRRVFEVLGDRTKCQPTDSQLSGLGFNGTTGAQAVVRVTGPKLRKTFNVKF